MQILKTRLIEPTRKALSREWAEVAMKADYRFLHDEDSSGSTSSKFSRGLAE